MHRKSIRTLQLCAALVAGVLAVGADGADPQVVFQGRIDSSLESLPPPWQGVRVGDAWELVYCFDPLTPNVCDAPGFGCYPAIYNVVLRVGDAAETLTGEHVGSITVTSRPPTEADSYQVSFRFASGVEVVLAMRDPTGFALRDEHLPRCDELPAVLAFSSRRFTMSHQGPIGGMRGGGINRKNCDPQLQCRPCSECIADYNSDGGVDGQDVQAFFGDWEFGLPCADVNHDGGVDGQDVQRFYRLWENGLCCYTDPDFNGDGVVNCRDLCEFIDAWRAGEARADANCDRVVDNADLAEYRRAYLEAGGPPCAIPCCPEIRVDLDGDGRAGCADVCAFQRLFVEGADVADVNCDGRVDQSDLIAWTEAYRAAGGPECPRGGDFNLDGVIDCRDIRAFEQAMASHAASADLDCDGAITERDAVVFYRAYLDWNRDGQLMCQDFCFFKARWRGLDPQTDMNCDGVIDLSDLAAYTVLFNRYYAGPPCIPCP